MALRFTATNSSNLVDSKSFPSAYPFIVGLWAKAGATGSTQTVWCSADTGSSNNYFYIGTSPNNWQIVVSTATGTVTNSAAILKRDVWTYIIARFISSTNRRLSVTTLQNDYVTNQSITANIPAGMDQMALGCLAHATATLFFQGEIAEFWWSNRLDIDLSGSAVAVERNNQKEIAFKGPFSSPRLARGIRAYWSLETGYRHLRPDENWFDNVAGNIPRLWTPSAIGPIVSVHPPIKKQRSELRIPGRQYFHVATASATATSTATGAIVLRTLAATGAGLAVAGAAVIPQLVNLPWAKKNRWAA